MRAKRGGSFNFPRGATRRERPARANEGGVVVLKDKRVEVPAGTNGRDGLELEIFTRQLLALRLKGQGERVRTSLLTKEQAARLRDALDALIREMDSCESPGLKAA